MRRKLIISWILFVGGILLDVVADIIDVWILGVFAGVLWTIGMVMIVNTSLSCNQKQKHNHNPHQKSEKENT